MIKHNSSKSHQPDQLDKLDYTLFPVLPAGGNGTRLWPLSRSSYPKQFSDLIGNLSLFQQSAKRLKTSNILCIEPHLVLTNSDYRFIVGEQLHALGQKQSSIVIEPESKNTAPAILAASLIAFRKNTDAILLVAPSDHVIPDINDFNEAIVESISPAKDGSIDCFGIEPSYPETGYGYIEISDHNFTSANVSEVLRFIEKPSSEKAECMLKTEKYLWNAGIFLFSTKSMIEAFKLILPSTSELVSDSVHNAYQDLDFCV
jgi:mannose-1-phosphate guanylyltransferase / mannose-6-phosphate isomerase